MLARTRPAVRSGTQLPSQRKLLADPLSEHLAAQAPSSCEVATGSKTAAIRAAFLADPNIRDCEVVRLLKEDGIKVSRELVRQVREKLGRKAIRPDSIPGTNDSKYALIRDAILANQGLQARLIVHLLANAGIEVTVPSVHYARTRMREKGLQVQRARPLRCSLSRPYPELNLEQERRLASSIHRAESYARHRWYGHLRGIGSPDDFADFVLLKLPFIVARYDPSRPTEARKSWKNFLCAGVLICEKRYRLQVLSAALGTSQSEVTRLLGVLGDIHTKKMPLEASAEKRGVAVGRIRKLLDAYYAYKNANRKTCPLHSDFVSLTGFRQERRIGAYTPASVELEES